jgi:NAD(P)-dependent dehydrogenase (short-subunit alcohol dehydrogenase family)
MDSSGTQGIGQCTVVYLALRGAIVYACAPDIDREHRGLAEAIEKIEKWASKPSKSAIYFHGLDLSSMHKTKDSARALRERLTEDHGARLDIMVNNAGIMSTSTELSEDGFEKTFEVNCLGHFIFINSLLGKKYDYI